MNRRLNYENGSKIPAEERIVPLLRHLSIQKARTLHTLHQQSGWALPSRTLANKAKFLIGIIGVIGLMALGTACGGNGITVDDLTGT